MKGISSEVEDIEIRKCRRNSYFGIIFGEIKGSSSEEEEIVIRKCSRITLIL